MQIRSVFELMAQSIVSLSEFKAKAAQMLAAMNKQEQTIIVTQNGAARAVVQSIESYERMQTALLLLKIMVQGEADVADSRETPQDDVFASMRARLYPDD